MKTKLKSNQSRPVLANQSGVKCHFGADVCFAISVRKPARNAQPNLVIPRARCAKS